MNKRRAALLAVMETEQKSCSFGKSCFPTKDLTKCPFRAWQNSSGTYIFKFSWRDLRYQTISAVQHSVLSPNQPRAGQLCKMLPIHPAFRHWEGASGSGDWRHVHEEQQWAFLTTEMVFRYLG